MIRDCVRFGIAFWLGAFALIAQTAPSRDSLLKSAESGDAKAMTELGKQALRQREPQLVEAAKWFRKAVELGDANAMAQLGRMYTFGWVGERNDEKAIELFRKVGGCERR